MSDIFAMQRANGDWFALDHHGRLRVPLFHSSQDAMIARLYNFGLLVFNPVGLDNAPTQSDSQATETWEDEGGAYAKCA